MGSPPEFGKTGTGMLGRNLDAQPGEPGHELLGLSVHYLCTTLASEITAAGLDLSARIYELEPVVIRRLSEGVQCPRDGRQGAAYVDRVEAPHAGNANYMLSYAWGYRIGDIVTALKNFCEKDGLDPATTYVWMCCFCVNQHRVKEAADSGQSVPFAVFREEFARRVSSIGHVLALMAPWHQPFYITRIWCVFEIFTADVTADCDVTIIMPPEQECAFTHDLVKGGLNKVWKALENLRVEDAQASVDDDRTNILALIEQGPGFCKLNCHVRRLLQDWFLSSAVRAAELLLAQGGAGSQGMLACAPEVGRLLMFTGRMDQAQSLLERVVAKAERDGSLECSEGANALRYLGSIQAMFRMDHQGCMAKLLRARAIRERTGTWRSKGGAEILWNMGMCPAHLHPAEGPGPQDCLLQAKALLEDLGELDSLVGADIVQMLSMMREGVGDVHGSIDMLRQAVGIRERIDCLRTPDGTKLLSILGQAMIQTGDLRAARDLFEQARRIREEISLTETYVGCLVMFGLAACASLFGDWDGAEAFMQRSFAIRKDLVDVQETFDVQLWTAVAELRLAQARASEAAEAIGTAKGHMHNITVSGHGWVSKIRFKVDVTAARISLALGKDAEAEESCRRVMDASVEATPERATAMLIRGLLQLRDSQPRHEPGALPLLLGAQGILAERQLLQGPLAAEVAHALARAYALEGQSDRAREQLEAARRIHEAMGNMEVNAQALAKSEAALKVLSTRAPAAGPLNSFKARLRGCAPYRESKLCLHDCSTEDQEACEAARASLLS